MLITDVELKKFMDYDPETGCFRWLTRPIETFNDGPRRNNAWSVWNSRFSGKIATGVIDGNGYCRISVNGRRYLAHRLAWFFMIGSWPKNEIDHIDGGKLNNRFANLREATHAENGRNRRLGRDNTSGLKGVAWINRERKWQAKITFEGKPRHILYSDCPAAASFAYQIEADKLHGEFARIA